MELTDLVHVVMPSFNAERSIESAIRSVIDQQYARVRLVVVDHGSTDLTTKIVSRYVASGALKLLELERSTDERRSAARPMERGAHAVLESAVDMSREWFLRLDSDDVLARSDSIVRLIDGSESSRLVVGRLAFYDQELGSSETYGVIPEHRSIRALQRGAAYSVPHHAVACRLDLLLEASRGAKELFDPRLGYGEDLDFTLKLLSRCPPGTIRFTDGIVSYKQLHSDSISQSTSLRHVLVDHLRILRRHGLLTGELSARIAADLALRGLGRFGSSLRTRFGFPGKRWADMHPYPLDKISRRLQEVAK